MSLPVLEQKYKRQFLLRSLLSNILIISFLILIWYICSKIIILPAGSIYIIIGGSIFTLLLFQTIWQTKHNLQTLDTIAQALEHISSTASQRPAPDLSEITLGRELLGEIVSNIYNLAANRTKNQTGNSNDIKLSLATKVLARTPLPMIAVNSEQTICYANDAAADYTNKTLDELIGLKFYDALNLWFSNEDTYESWLKQCKEKSITASHVWQRVKLSSDEQSPPKLFDLVASFSLDSSSGFEVLLGIFDHSERYGHDEQDIGYVAMAVHELRTPITILRGYIEVLEEEFGAAATPEQSRFIQNMDATAQQLTAFVSNILNIARIDENHLELTLKEEKWADVLESALKDLDLRAKVHNKIIMRQISENMPTVAVDRTSIYEVINNLIDNAIKYGGNSKEIIVETKLDNGVIATTIQDMGVGIPESAVGSIFTKLYRSHVSRGHVSGTGLGLYISKKIVNAHGGQIWFRSKEGQGSVFGFSLKPFALLAEESKIGDNDSTEVHGWIKNHSLYRR